jgi:hypothetical protein
MKRFWICAAVAVAFGSVSSACAQSLQRVTVTSFSLASDESEPQVGARFHLIITLGLAQRVDDVENLQLPDLASLDVLGDERGLSSAPQGSLYRETLTVAAHDGGSITIAPATFDAIDNRDGKAKQWSTNSIVIHVVGGAASTTSALRVLVGRILLAAGVGVVVLGALMLPMLRKPPQAIAPPPPPPPEPPVAPSTTHDQLMEALRCLRSDPTRGGVMRARAILHRMVGAPHGETLDDVMRRAKNAHPDLLAVLPSIERAAYTYDEDFAHARTQAETALEMAAR